MTGNWPIFTDKDTKAKCHRASKTRTKSRTVSSTWFSAPKHAAGRGREREGVTVVPGGRPQRKEIASGLFAHTSLQIRAVCLGT